MKIETHHILGLRDAIEQSQNEFLKTLYSDMAFDIRPKISEVMIRSLENSVLAERTYEQAADALGVSKIAIGQNTIKALKRLVEYEKTMGRQTPDELSDVTITAVMAKNHVEFFKSALNNYINLQ